MAEDDIGLQTFCTFLELTPCLIYCVYIQKWNEKNPTQPQYFVVEEQFKRAKNNGLPH